MKIKKEFVILGVVVVAFVGVIAVPKIIGGSDSTDNVTINFNEENTVHDDNLSEDTDYVYEGVTLEDDVDFEMPEDGVTVEGKWDGSAGSVPEDDITTTPEGMETDIAVELGPEERLSAEAYVNLAMNYVCGTKGAEFDQYFTSLMKASIGSKVDSEPYSSLNGNTTFSNLKISNTDSSFSFTAGNGETYTFLVLFSGSLISDILPQ